MGVQHMNIDSDILFSDPVRYYLKQCTENSDND